MKFDLGDYVFLKVSPMHGVTQFSIKGKLAPRYIGPFEIVERVGDVAYRLNSPSQLGHIHIFLVSMLKKYIQDSSYVLPYAKIPLQVGVTYEEQPTEVLAKVLRILHNKKTSMVKVC